MLFNPHTNDSTLVFQQMRSWGASGQDNAHEERLHALYEGVVGDDVGEAAGLAHGVVGLQRPGAVLALYAHVHERRVRVHVALHAAARHLAEQLRRALQVLQ